MRATILALCFSIASPAALLAQPAASPQVTTGGQLFAEHCALCHGPDGRGGAGFQTPIWGAQTQIAKFATAQGLFEYNQMLMPFNDPTTLNDEQKWAITAYILANHGAMPRNQTLNPQTAPGLTIR